MTAVADNVLRSGAGTEVRIGEATTFENLGERIISN